MGIQEDEYIEWASFWAFLLAAAAALVASRDYRGTVNRLPWFYYGLALFCFVVAMEEISWGQRVLGYRPPVYFLEHNFQQELNIHNVIDTDYRKLALSLTIVGYGVALPLLALFVPLRSLLDRVGINAPSPGLSPLFFATFLMYIIYPFSHSGEWVELMLGLGMLFALLDRWNSPYWIRDRCIRKTQTRVFFVYSYGPNRRRDSTETEIRGDDVGTYITPSR